MGDGDGWADCDLGHTHWGRFGAAGLLAYHRDADGQVWVLLQQRAWWGLGGGTWGMFGGALHSHEDAVTGALRETSEECTLDVTAVNVHGTTVEDHGGWSYTSLTGSLPELLPVEPASRETRRAEWVRVEEVTDRKLFEPFARCWPGLRDAMKSLVLVVDAANVVGARADGWWKDRAGANARLRDDLKVLDAGVRGLPGGLVPFDACFPEVVLVVEGAARRVADEPANGIQVVAAPGSGDDKIVDLVRNAGPDTVPLVVTADRELRARCEAAGATVTGPRWLLDCI
ncbi:ADP-ribose pyrophosphatase YjhB (NUDIX family) [Actinomadura pelletieri DSM 43383]|uniref:ADP-ribose pyrophosphatase YjhB (NUDIX family) n=1 Tax=Actinomadura pelletieri DSM 43383 TaxID=1120940 RepID=A0A495QHP4_9ACTN|nr:NUDIX domain-containing protein [Actinomadura pelletieri]RKS71631.1 ADP-ribose pyrophosphatase YjhB (NUDIX family) [Actinomadura pelletieri DSM 43383]